MTQFCGTTPWPLAVIIIRLGFGFHKIGAFWDGNTATPVETHAIGMQFSKSVRYGKNQTGPEKLHDRALHTRGM